MDDTNIRSQNRALNIDEFEKGKLVLSSMPRALFVELTQNCNLNCPYCKGEDTQKYRPDLNMQPELFSSVAEKLFPTAELVDLRGSGESTILKDFSKYVEITTDFGVQIRIVTNGMNPNPSIWEQLMASGAIIGISCDTADPKMFSGIRKGGNLNRLIKTVKTITKYRNLYSVPVENVYFTCVVSLKNINTLPELIKLAKDLHLSKIILFPVSLPQSHPWNLKRDIPSVVKGLESAFKISNSLNLTLQLGAAFDESLRIEKDLKSKCLNPWTYLLIDYSGRVGFCDHLIGNSRFTFDSFYEKEFDNIWNGWKFKWLRRTHRKGKPSLWFDSCRWCYQMRYVDFEHMFYPKYLDNIVSNKSRHSFHEKF